MKKVLCLFAMLILTVAVFTGCGSNSASTESNSADTANSAEPEVYKIGFLNHLTGDGAVYGESMRKATEIAVEEINAAGGVNGKKIEVIYEDDRSNAADAVTGFNKLVDVDKVPAVLGTCTSTRTLAVLPIAKQKGIPVISQSSTSPALRGPYVGTFFGMMPTDEAQGGVGIPNLCEALGAKDVAVMYLNNDAGNGVRNEFVKAWTAKGNKVLIEEGFEPGATDFRASLLKVKKLNPEFIVCATLVAEGCNLVKQAKELGIDAQWVFESSMQSDEVPQLAGAAAEGIIAIQHGQTENNPAYDKYEAAFKAKFGTEPTIWSHYSYEATKIVADAIAQNGYTSDGIKQYLTGIKDRQVPWGTLTMDKDGIAMGVFSYWVVKDGKYTFGGNVDM